MYTFSLFLSVSNSIEVIEFLSIKIVIFPTKSWTITLAAATADIIGIIGCPVFLFLSQEHLWITRFVFWSQFWELPAYFTLSLWPESDASFGSTQCLTYHWQTCFFDLNMDAQIKAQRDKCTNSCNLEMHFTLKLQSFSALVYCCV